MKNLITFVIGLFAFLMYGQKTFNELERDLLSATSPQKATLYNEMSEIAKANDLDQMKTFAEQALQYALKERQDLEIAKAKVNIAIYHLSKSDYPNAIENFKTAEKKLIEYQKDQASTLPEQDLLLAKIFANQGVILSEQSQYFKALTKHQQALKLFEKLNNQAMVGRINNNIGVIYWSIADYIEAKKYFQNAADIQTSENDPTLGYTLTNIGKIEIALSNFDQAQIQFDKALRIFDKTPDDIGLGELYIQLGHLFKKQNQQAKAKDYFEKSMVLFEKSGYQFGLSETYIQLGQLYLEDNKIDLAKTNALKAIDLANQLGATETQANAFLLLSNVYEKVNKSEAFDALKKHQFYKNQLTDVASLRQTFETEKQQALENIKIEQEQKFKLQQEQSKRYWLIGLFSIIALGGGLFAWQRLKHLKTEKQKAQLQSELAGFEMQALHLQMNPHFVFNCLAAISAYIMQNSQEEAVKYLSKFSKLMRLTLDFSKETLISIDKEIESLTNYLDLEKLRFNQVFDFQITKDSQLEDDCALPPLLIQPLVENAIIHGIVPNKSEIKGLISIDFKQDNDFLKITITDNGIGINEAKKIKAQSVFEHQSQALEIIKNRLDKLGKMNNIKTQLQIQDLSKISDKNGTQVLVTLPLQYLKQ